MKFGSGWTTCCGVPVTGNAKSLIMTAALFLTITAAQFVASLPMYANSLALRADCLSMLVDGLSYLGNLAAECHTDKGSKKCVELGVSGVSLSLLLGFTIAFAFEAAHEVFGPQAPRAARVDAADTTPSVLESRLEEAESNDRGSNDVDPKIVLAFAVLGLLFDGISLLSFGLWADTTHKGDGSAAGGEGGGGALLGASSSGNGGGGGGRAVELRGVVRRPFALVAEGDEDGEEGDCGEGKAGSFVENGGVEEGGGDDSCVLIDEQGTCYSLPVVPRPGPAPPPLFSPDGARETRRTRNSEGGRGGKAKGGRALLPLAGAGGTAAATLAAAAAAGGANLNMWSALLHVGSDLLRSATTLLEAIYLLSLRARGGGHGAGASDRAEGDPSLPGSDDDGGGGGGGRGGSEGAAAGDASGRRPDAVAALVVCGIIVVGALAALSAWVRELQADLGEPLKRQKAWDRGAERMLSRATGSGQRTGGSGGGGNGGSGSGGGGGGESGYIYPGQGGGGRARPAHSAAPPEAQSGARNLGRDLGDIRSVSWPKPPPSPLSEQAASALRAGLALMPIRGLSSSAKTGQQQRRYQEVAHDEGLDGQDDDEETAEFV